MQQKRDYKGELRAAHTLRALKSAKHSLQTTPAGIFMRITLGVIYMYLIFASHQVFGVAGPLFISVLFLVAFFVPYLYQILTGLWEKRRAQSGDERAAEESQQEG